MRTIPRLNHIAILCCLNLLIISSPSAEQLWHGLTVEPENRCSPYDKKKQCPYPQSIEDEIVARMEGHVYGPYSGRYFITDTQTDIEHIVAASEGHDSGLCSASKEKREQFATDLLNLTLAAPEVNRCGAKGKCGLDAGEWMPEKNKCWFANRVIEIKTKYNLSVNQTETKALDAVLKTCDNFEIIFYPKTDENRVGLLIPNTNNALTMYDDNDNGRITCKEARAHGIAPVHQEHPAYLFMNDSDDDGIVCE